MAEDSPDLLTQARQRLSALGQGLRARDVALGQHADVEAALLAAIAATTDVEAALDAAVGAKDQPRPGEDEQV